MTASEKREALLFIARGYIGCGYGDEKHKKILENYNTAVKSETERKRYSPSPRTHQMAVGESWCATFVSVIGLLAGVNEYPLECSCNNQISQLKNKKLWEENDAYIPNPGDIIYYDWDDGTNYATSDNKNRADHVGIVESVSDNYITVIEGNKGNRCARRKIKINGRYIRGFGRIPFEDDVVKTSVAKFKEYRVKVVPQNGLNIRNGAGTSFKKLGALKCGTIVTIKKEDSGWGYIGSGWICLDYTKKI